MWGRQHFSLTLITLILMLPLILSVLFFLKFSGDQIILITGAIILFSILGSLLPDADSINNGSKIFYTLFAPIAWLVSLFEPIIAKLLGRNMGHRESYHSFFGILLTSAIVILIFALFLMYIKVFMVSIIFASYLALVFGQSLHILQDKIMNPFIFLIIVLIIFGLIYGGVYLFVKKYDSDFTLENNLLESKNSVINTNDLVQKSETQKMSLDFVGACESICKDRAGLREVQPNDFLNFISCVCNNYEGFEIDSMSGKPITEDEIDERFIEKSLTHYNLIFHSIPNFKFKK